MGWCEFVYYLLYYFLEMLVKLLWEEFVVFLWVGDLGGKKLKVW